MRAISYLLIPAAQLMNAVGISTRAAAAEEAEALLAHLAVQYKNTW